MPKQWQPAYQPSELLGRCLGSFSRMLLRCRAHNTGPFLLKLGLIKDLRVDDFSSVRGHLAPAHAKQGLARNGADVPEEPAAACAHVSPGIALAAVVCISNSVPHDERMHLVELLPPYQRRTL